ncbi:MAG: hypothetical protein GX868_01555 [Actinobacteria bacterium]|nr:hypothetical protein [Actinomycetota bacterium]
MAECSSIDDRRHPGAARADEVRAGVVSFEAVNRGPWNVHAFGLVNLIRTAFHAVTLTVSDATNPAARALTLQGKRLDIVRKLPGRVSVSLAVADVGPLDLLFVVAHDMADLDRLYVSQDDWFSSAATKVLILVEAWPLDAEQHPLCFSRVLPLFDHVYTCLESGQAALATAAQMPVSVLAQSVDVLNTPASLSGRTDILSFGRRAEAQHELFLRWVAERGGWYRFDTLPLADGFDIWLHRRSMADSMAFSALTVCNYARFDNTARIGPARVVGTRFWEVVASGSVPIGDAPNEPMWRREFAKLPAHIQLAVECDPDDLTLVDHAVEIGKDPRVRAEIRAFALEHCDFAHRARQILEDVRIPVPPLITDRLASLDTQRDRLLTTVAAG